MVSIVYIYIRIPLAAYTEIWYFSPVTYYECERSPNMHLGDEIISHHCYDTTGDQTKQPSTLQRFITITNLH